MKIEKKKKSRDVSALPTRTIRTVGNNSKRHTTDNHSQDDEQVSTDCRLVQSAIEA